ncbi:MAG: hypothetical protein R3C11_10970 [Planctomycetaceae bacterium]
MQGAAQWEQALTARENEIETRSSNIGEYVITEKNRLESTRLELKQLRQEVRDLEVQKSELLDKETALQSQAANWEERTQDLSASESRLVDMEATLQQRETELEESLSAFQVQQQKFEELSEKESERLEADRIELEALRTQIKSQRAELQELQDQLSDERKELEQERELLEAQREEFASEKQELDDERQRLQKWEASIDSHIAEELTRRLATDRESLELEKQHFTEASSELTEKEHQIAVAERKLSEAMIRLEKLEKDNKRLTEEKERLEKELISAEARREQIQSMLDANLDQLDDLKEKIELERGALLEAEMKHMESQNQQSEQLEQLSEKLLHSTQKIEELEEDHENLVAQHAKLNDEKTALQEKHEDLLAQQDQLVSKLQDLEEEYAELKSNSAVTAAAQQELNQEAEAEFEATREEFEQLRTELATERDQLADAQERIEAERNQLESERNELLDNRDQINSEREELEELRAALEEQKREIEELESAARRQIAEQESATSSQLNALIDVAESPLADEVLDDDLAIIAGLEDANILDEPLEEVIDEPVNEIEEPESSAAELDAEEEIPTSGSSAVVTESSSTQLNSLRSQLADMFDMHEEESARRQVEQESSAPELTSSESDLGFNTDDFLDIDENSSLTEPAPEEEEAPAAESEEAAEDDDSIEAYMRRLIARTQRGTAGEEFETTKKKKDLLNKPLAKEASHPKADASSQIDSTPAEPARPVRERAKVNPDEVRANLNTLREVANANARTALATHSSKQLRETLMLKLIVSVVAMIITAIFAFSGLWSTESYTWQTIAAATIACGMLFEFFRSFMKIKQAESMSRIQEELQSGRDMTIEREVEYSEPEMEDEPLEIAADDSGLSEPEEEL